MTNIVVPQLGESVVEARVAKWLKKPGDHVEAGEAVVELETDKIDLEVSAERAGVVSRIERAEGSDVKIGEVLGVLDENGAGPAAAAPAGDGRPGGEAGSPAGDGRREAPRATPTARRMAKELEIDLATVRGSGVAGRITRQDVEQQVVPRPADRPPRPAATMPRRFPPSGQRPRRCRRAPHCGPRATAPKSGCGCRSGARPSPAGSSRPSAPRRCSPPSTRWTCRR
jgi:2-oxoglutarate dehydrogenase E2 component (dihydrolipoamide succinyltransferase)